MSIESTMNFYLNRYPQIKKVIKRMYQKIMCAVSGEFSSAGDIVRVSPNDDGEYFFGYYDKSPWDADNHYMLCMRARDTWSSVSPEEPAEILLLNRQNPEDNRVLATTRSWNVQQGCMAQWLGPDFSRRIIYNDFRNGKYCSVILDINTMEERILPIPVYTVSPDGKTALSLDFSRLHRLRPGYGYSNLSDETRTEKIPDRPCIWRLDIEKGEVNEVLKYTDFAAFEPRPEMTSAEHKVNHLMISPNGKRFMVLHRWFDGSRKYTRLVTANVDGTALYNLSDDDMVSHCCWKNDEEILAFENKEEDGQGYFLMRDRTQDYMHFWPELEGDGHPSYSPDGTLVVTDSYPNSKRIAEIRIMKDDVVIPISRVYAPFKYDNETRCDLHPRWSRDGREICFDAVFEGRRGLYVVKVPEFSRVVKQFNGRIKIVYLMTSCKRRGPVQQTLNIIKHLDLEKYCPVLISLYREMPGDSMLDKYLPEISEFICLRSSLKRMFLGDRKRLYKTLERVGPAAVHSVGIFPALFMLKYTECIHCTTIRSDIYTSFYQSHGKIRGDVMKRISLQILKKCQNIFVCSKSLSDFYERKLKCRFPYIRNGVDTEQFYPDQEGRGDIQMKLKLPTDKCIIIYTGSFVPYKNQEFAIRNFLRARCARNSCLVLLGKGPLLAQLKERYKGNDAIIFAGFVPNIWDYLRAADMFLSTSSIEGMPNGVLEALASGLPVLLSNIPQHLEILHVNSSLGLSYEVGNDDDFIEKLDRITALDLTCCGPLCRKVAIEEFSAYSMSQRYQQEYKKMIEGNEM